MGKSKRLSSSPKTKRDYSGEYIYVGIDSHLRNWVIKIIAGMEDFARSYHTRPDAKGLLTYLKKYYPGGTYLCVYEAGFSGFWIQRELEALGVGCMVTHAADVPTTHKEKLYKDDGRDALKLAKGLRSGDLTEVYVLTEEQERARDIVRRRHSIGKHKRRIMTQIKMHLHKWNVKLPTNKEMKHWSRRFLEKLYQIQEEQNDEALGLMLEELELQRKLELKVLRKIRTLSRSSVYKKDVDLLLSVPGIGVLTAMVLLTEIVDFHRFKTLNQLCSYIGLCPRTHSSGDKQRIGNMSKRGNSRARCAIIESAWVAIRYDEDLGTSYENWKEKTAKSNKAIVKVARRLLNRIRFILKNEQPYERGYVTGQCAPKSACEEGR